MAKQKSRKVVVKFTVKLTDENAKSSLKALKARVAGEGVYIAEALGESIDSKVGVAVFEAE